MNTDQLRTLAEPGAAQAASSALPFWQMLYQYLWPFLYFRDVTYGQKLERQQNYRFNRSRRMLLRGFAFKWIVLTVLCFCIGGGMPAPIVISAAFFVTGTWTLVFSILLITAWIWLERFPELY